MDHLEAIVEIKNIIPQHFIEKMIALIDEKAVNKLLLNGGVLDTDKRNVKGYKVQNSDDYWYPIEKEIRKYYIYYTSKFNLLDDYPVNQIELLKYEIGGKIDLHTDNYPASPRTISLSMNLNDDYEGGDFIFYDQKKFEVKRIKLGKGSVLFFPSNFLYPHSVESITKGARYSIVSWL
tara:strand:+ start:72 stop:605 length:534 start_codon:yes stop_codon:yes gene_type:complete